MLRYGLEAGDVPPEEEAAIEARIRTGRPLSDEAFVEALETASGRQLEAPQTGRGRGVKYSVPKFSKLRPIAVLPAQAPSRQLSSCRVIPLFAAGEQLHGGS